MEQVKSEKVFFNVFPTLKVGDELQMLFSDVEVKKITTNSGRDFLHIHILCRHLIQKKQIWLMEQRIKEQLFGRAAVKIEIVEEFQLSELYTPQAILTEYRESLIEELRQTSVLAANMFARADLRFEEGNLIHLELLDTIVSEGRKEEIVTLVERVLRERFRIDAKLLVAYKETDQEGTREYDEQRIQQEINAIFERRARQRGEEPERAAENQEIGSDTKKRQAEPGEKAAGGKEKAAAGKEPSGRRKEFQKKEFKKKDYVRPLKLGDDPNLIYGRNFEDEPIRLDQVVEEMGEITFHGKIISLDTREIKNERTIIIFAVSDFTDTISVKMFIKNEQLAEILGSLKKGGFVKIKGVTTIDKFDGELTIGSVTGIKKIGDFTVKREDLNHTGAHKINNVLGQCLLAKRMGKTRVIAETGASQHGVATATAAALMGLECEIFMGKEDTDRQALNVYRMELLGAKVHPVTSGTMTLKDAVNETMREWSNRVADTHYILGSVMGPHPFPMIVRDFQSVISQEAKEQILKAEGKLPAAVVACVGGGSNAMGAFYNFIEDKDVELIGCEAAGKGVDTALTAATIATGSLGIFHGMKSYFCQDEYGQIAPVYSISAGLDYPGIGPEHAYLHDIGRAQYVPITDDEAVDAFEYLARTEGIICAIESAHAVAQVRKIAKNYSPDQSIIVCLSGRGDKDVAAIARYRGVDIHD